MLILSRPLFRSVPGFANVIGAHATVDLVLRKGGTRLVGLILALGAVAELAIQLHHTLHALGPNVKEKV